MPRQARVLTGREVCAIRTLGLYSVGEMAAFMHRLRTAHTEVAAKALGFVILTAARAREVR